MGTRERARVHESKNEIDSESESESESDSYIMSENESTSESSSENKSESESESMCEQMCLWGSFCALDFVGVRCGVSLYTYARMHACTCTCAHVFEVSLHL